MTGFVIKDNITGLLYSGGTVPHFRKKGWIYDSEEEAGVVVENRKKWYENDGLGKFPSVEIIRVSVVDSIDGDLV